MYSIFLIDGKVLDTRKGNGRTIIKKTDTPCTAHIRKVVGVSVFGLLVSFLFSGAGGRVHILLLAPTVLTTRSMVRYY